MKFWRPLTSNEGWWIYLESSSTVWFYSWPRWEIEKASPDHGRDRLNYRVCVDHHCLCCLPGILSPAGTVQMDSVSTWSLTNVSSSDLFCKHMCFLFVVGCRFTYYWNIVSTVTQLNWKRLAVESGVGPKDH